MENGATILFAMHLEPGHHLGTFRLAGQLRSHGFHVSYLGVPSLRPLIESHGFTFIPFAESVFAKDKERRALDAKNPAQSAKETDEALFRDYVGAILDGTLDEALTSSRPDLLLCDSFLWYVALRAHRLEIPTLHISTSLFYYDNPWIPPATTPRGKPANAYDRAMVFLAWKWMHFKYLFTKRLASKLTGKYRRPVQMHHLYDTFRQVAQESGFPCQKNRTYRMDEIGPHLTLPEIVLCPRSFQFPGKLPQERIYCGDFVNLERSESEFPLPEEDRPLIYCSLGTSAASYPQAHRVFESVVLASRERRDWHFILHISDESLIARFTPSDNLQITRWVPQLALLRRAAVMVTHGGLNSIMECVNLSVPMVILPCQRDQPGNAARAAYHHLGLVSDPAHLTPAKLLAQISTAMSSEDLRSGIETMKAKIQEEDGMQNAIEFIRSHLPLSGPQTHPQLQENTP